MKVLGQHLCQALKFSDLLFLASLWNEKKLYPLNSHFKKNENAENLFLIMYIL